jgi:glycine cleavage system regulatory protein
MPSFVISVLGDDRAGLVDALSGVIADHGGNWERSHLTQLAGKFAGVVLVQIPREQTEAFADAIATLDRSGLLHLSVDTGHDTAAAGSTVRIHLVGNDRPGIVHELSHLLAGQGVSIDDLETDTVPAPMAGSMLFEAMALLRLPPGLTTGSLVADIEALAADLMVDVEIMEDPSS